MIFGGEDRGIQISCLPYFAFPASALFFRLSFLTLISKFKFSFVVPIRFPLQWWREGVEKSVRFTLYDHTLDSCHQPVSGDVTQSNTALQCWNYVVTLQNNVATILQL